MMADVVNKNKNSQNRGLQLHSTKNNGGSKATLKQKPNEPLIQTEQGLTRIDSILEGMEYVAPGCAIRYTTPSIPSSAQGEGGMSVLARRLRPFPCGMGIALSFHGRLFRRCECKGYFVESREENSRTVWLCRDCKKPRLAQRRKTDQELIAELLANPDLRGWEVFFVKEQSTRLAVGSWQQRKLRAIAERLGIEVEVNIPVCAIVEGGAR